MSKIFEEIGDHWRDDTFDRKAYASFLTRYLRAKVLGAGMSPQLRPFTMALDAQWGSGKTFFINRWSEDLRSSADGHSGHTVVTFDAWSADYASDPLVAFMSELRAELQRAVDGAGLLKSSQTKAKNALNKATTSLRRLALPAAGVVAKGVVKKFSGVDLGAFGDAIKGHDSSGTTAKPDPITLGSLVSEKQTDAVLDQVFKAQLSEHAKRKESIQAFKVELGIVLDALSKRKNYSAPLFIMVDELDRCKPSFAVGLLEAVKHIFGIPGICVVIATNMEQLAHTVKAVYGEGFDARTYLQRFFDAIYALPPATGPRLLEVQLKALPIFTSERCKWAMPAHGFDPDNYGDGKPGMLAWIFDGFQLDLRSRGQILELMEASSLGVAESKKIHVPWLALICSLWHSHRTLFHTLEARARANESGDDVWKEGLSLDRAKRTYLIQADYEKGPQKVAVSLRDLGSSYCSRANKDLIVMRSRVDHTARGFSVLVEREILLDAPSTYMSNARYPVGLLDYFGLVSTAGHFKIGEATEPDPSA